MSMPKQAAKRRKLEKKRLRRREAHVKRQKRRQGGWCGPDWFEPVAALGVPGKIAKMSDVLGDFIAPVADSADDIEAYERLLSLGVIAWNVALQPEWRREAMIGAAIDDEIGWDHVWEREMRRDLLRRLVARKLECFAACQRPILAFHLDELEDGGYYLSVASGVV